MSMSDWNPEQHPLSVADELLMRLDRLAGVLDAQNQRSSEMIALLRGSINHQLYAGTVLFRAQGPLWAYETDFVVPFASVFYADTQNFGPFTISTDSSGAEAGVGTFVSLTAGGDTNRVPLIGRHLSITTAKANAALFIAVFTRTGSQETN